MLCFLEASSVIDIKDVLTFMNSEDPLAKTIKDLDLFKPFNELNEIEKAFKAGLVMSRIAMIKGEEHECESNTQ